MLSKVFIVVDALDECNEIGRHALLFELKKLLPTAHLLFTSRPYIVDFAQYFDHFSLLEVRASDHDIKVYVGERIANNNRLKRLVQNDDVLRNDIIEVILSNVKGM